MFIANFPISHLGGLKEIQKENVETVSIVLDRITELYTGACEARLTVMPGDTTPEQRNWRAFLVGGRALVMLKNGDLITVDGYNTKRTGHPSCPTRKCAEERILEQLGEIDKATPVEYVVALVVVGNFQSDDTSGHHCNTLHPCGSCRRILSLNGFMRDLTLIITAHPPDETGQPLYAEIHTRKSLVGLHSTN